MKRALLVIFYLAFFIFLKPVSAADFELLSAGQTIDSDYLRTAQTIQIDGDVRGDVFLVGGIVTVNGKIDGDLFVLGGKVNVNGPVGNSVRVIAGDVTINTQVSRNVLVVCGNCNVTKQASISGSLIASGANLELSASKIGRGFRFFGSRLYLNSEITNEAFVVADREFLLGPQASISSDLKYTGGSEAILEPGATVAGHISYQQVNQEDTFPKFFGARAFLSSYNQIEPLIEVIKFFISALIGFILLGLFSAIFEKTAMAIEKQPITSLGWGIVISLIFPLLVVLFGITIVGLPVSVILILLGSLVWVMTQYLTAFFLGRKIMLTRFGERRGWALFLGLFLIAILGRIPFLGPFLKIVLVLFALGAVVLAYKHPAIIKQLPPKGYKRVARVKVKR